MLRPATPLAIIFFVAFVLLLISTLSTPIIQSIPLGTYQGYNFGVFGYCKDGGKCVGPKIGYDPSALFPNNAGNFLLSGVTRDSLAGTLIVHPIAAFLSLVCFGLAIAAHFHAPSHSPRYLLGLLILTIPTLFVTLLAFLLDLLLFVPHMQWAGWIVLAATLLITASTVVTCAMRRTLVSRKARKKRIEENVDMNGATYYDSLAERHAIMAEDRLPRADSPPPLDGTVGVNKGGQKFATYEMGSVDARSDNGLSINDRTPLDPNRAPSFRSSSTGGGPRVPYAQPGEVPPMPVNGRPSMENNRLGRIPSRDQYGNPLGPGNLPPPGLRHRSSQGSLASDRSNGYSRGRGGYGPPPRGAPRGRYGPPRGGFGPRGGYRGGPPPPGWNGRGRGGPMGRGGPGPRPGQSLGYNNDPYFNGPRGPPPMNGGYAGEDDLPIGTAMAMDERRGISSPAQGDFAPHAGFADAPHAGYSDQPHAGFPDPPHAGYADDDIAGGETQGMIRRESDRSEPRSPTSFYSSADPAYVPPRAAWGPAPTNSAYAQPGPMHRLQTDVSDPHSSGMASSRVLPSTPNLVSPISPRGMHGSISHRRGGSDNYYEDVAPQFAEPAPSPMAGEDDIRPALPSSLTPGPAANPYIAASQVPQHLTNQPHSQPVLGNVEHGEGADFPVVTDDMPPGLEAIPDGTRSPGEGSEASHFTSISERPVNPHWAPGGPGSRGGGSTLSAARVQRSRRDDAILNANPDFSVPGLGARGRGNGRGRIIPGGLTPGGRYPTDI